jgi:Periplasmic binding protein
MTGRWRVAAKLAVLIGVIVNASSQFMGTPRAADPIKIGWVGPLSPPGGYAEGALMKQAAQLAADEINAKGGMLGRQIEVFADTRGKPEEGTAAARGHITPRRSGQAAAAPTRADSHTFSLGLVGPKSATTAHPKRAERMLPNERVIRARRPWKIAMVVHPMGSICYARAHPL